MSAAAIQSAEAVIHADAAYGIEEIKSRLGIGEFALRKMRRKGLLVRRVGRRSFVLGRDLLAHIEQHGKLVTPEAAEGNFANKIRVIGSAELPK